MLTGVLPGNVKIVASDSGRGLRAGGEVTVTDHGTMAYLDLFLQPGGSIIGRVQTATGKFAGRNITVRARTNSGLRFQTLTDENSSFRFDPLPLEPVYLSADDQDGNRAEEVTVRLFESDQQVTLQFIPRGTIAGQVVFADGTAVGFAHVTLSRYWETGITTIADFEGKFLFDRIFSGPFTVSAVDPVMNINGTVSGALKLDGEKIALTISLTAMGTVKGVVYSVDKKPAIGIRVTLSSVYSGFYRLTQTNGEGRFQFDRVPVVTYYPYSLFASDAGSGDRSETRTVIIQKHGEEVSQDLTLAGFGEVDVVVKRASGVPIVGAIVRLSGAKEQVTDATGVAPFRSLIARQYWANAIISSLQVYTPSVSFTVKAGERGLVNLSFGKKGTITGRVLAADKLTPVAGVDVLLNGYGRTVLTDSQGQFSFPFLDIGTNYSFQARVKGQVRAVLDNVRLNTDEEVKEVEMVLIPVGTVTGKVFDASGAPLQSAFIQLSFVAPLSRSGQSSDMYIYSGRDGSYQAEQVPIGPVLIKASSSYYYGPVQEAEAKGALSYDNEVLVVNLYLGNNQVELPASLQTATVTYQLAKDGSYEARSPNWHYGSEVECICNNLTVTVNGQVSFFPEGRLGKYEQDKQGIGITREGPGGIVITRKLFAPKRGVAVRALELFTNPTDQPISLQLEIEYWRKRTYGSMPTVQSAPGYIAIPKKIGWLSYYNYEGNFVYWREIVGDGAMGTLFGGLSKTDQLFQTSTNESQGTQVKYGMKDVQIEPGATVAFLHFNFLSWDKKMGEMLLNRLRGLPPEMLEGLSQEEQDSIINFDLKKDRDAKLTPPVMLSKLSVQVFQKVGTKLLLLPNARVDFQSADPIFPLTHRAMTDPNGLLILDYRKMTNWWSTPPPLPIGPMRIQAFAHIGMHALIATSTIASEPMTVTDQNGELSATLVFTETGVAEVSFERPGGITENAHITLTHKETGKKYTVANITSPTSSATLLALPVGRYQAMLTIDHPQISGGIVGYRDIDISASTETALFIPVETGHLSGTVTNVSGQLVKGVKINLQRPCVYDNKEWCSSGVVYTDQFGGYQFIHLPLGLARLVIQEPGTDLEIDVQIHNARDGKTIRNIVVGVLGDIRVQVIFPNGLPAVHSRVELNYGKYTGQTDETGKITFLSIPVRTRSYNIRAFRPEERLSFLSTEQLVLLEKHGEMVHVVLKLPIVADLEVKATNCGEPTGGRSVHLTKVGSSDLAQVERATDYNNVYGKDSAENRNEGMAIFKNVAEGEYLLRVFSRQGGWPVFSATATVSIGNDNQTIRINAAFCRLPTTIIGQVFAADAKTAIPNRPINLTYSAVGQRNYVYTDEEGRFEVTVDEYVGEVKIEVWGVVQTVTLREQGGTITLPPFVLPLSVVKVKVSRINRGLSEAPSNLLLLATPGVSTVYNHEKSIFSNFHKAGYSFFLGLPAGDFEIMTHQYDTGHTAIRKGRIEAIEKVVEIDILLPPVNDMRILVKNADGSALKTGRIGIDEVGSSFTILRDLEQGKDGEMILKEIPAGVPLVIAADNGDTISRPEFIILPETDQLVTVTLSFPKRTASVTGQAVAADGVTPLTEGTYGPWKWTLPTESVLPTPFGFSGSGQGSFQLDANGTFRIDALPAGSIRLRIDDSASNLFADQTLTLTEGEVQSITLIANKENAEDHPVVTRFFDCESFSECLLYQTPLRIGKRDVLTNIGTGYHTEGETVLLPPVSVGSLALSRRFVNMPGSDRGVLSIDQIKNPYPVSIAITVERGEDPFWLEIDRYHHPTGGLILSLLNQQDRTSLHVFASSAEKKDQRIVVPAMSCRSVINLWDVLPVDTGLLQGETFQTGIDLLNRFATLDLKSIVLEGDSCPLAQ